MLDGGYDDLSEVKRFPIRMWDAGHRLFTAELRTFRGMYFISDQIRTLPDLEPAVGPMGNDMGRTRLPASLTFFRRLDNAWLFDGLVFDAEFKQIQLVWGLRPFIQTYLPSARVAGSEYLSPWGITQVIPRGRSQRQLRTFHKGWARPRSREDAVGHRHVR